MGIRGGVSRNLATRNFTRWSHFSASEILTSIDVISIPIDPLPRLNFWQGIKTDGTDGPGQTEWSCRRRIRIGRNRGIRAACSLPPVAKHGGLQRSRRLHHRYWVLITADRLDASTVHLSLAFSLFFSLSFSLCLSVSLSLLIFHPQPSSAWL